MDGSTDFSALNTDQYRVQMWALWAEPSEAGPPLFEGSLAECFRRFPVVPSEEADARKALMLHGVYFGGCGGEYQIRRVYDATGYRMALAPGSNLWGDLVRLPRRLWDRVVLGRRRKPHRLD